MEEIWIKITDYERYSVSSLGSIKIISGKRWVNFENSIKHLN